MPRRILLFGNSGSGKSSLARRLCQRSGLAHLDLDTLAWQPIAPPQRRPLAASAAELDAFTAAQTSWVIEGCYADLLELLVDRATEAIWLNLPIEDCLQNARARPWEPHKYPSKEAQDANLGMLEVWIADYRTRADTFSFAAHQALFEALPGAKRVLTSNHESAALA